MWAFALRSTRIHDKYWGTNQATSAPALSPHALFFFFRPPFIATARTGGTRPTVTGPAARKHTHAHTNEKREREERRVPKGRSRGVHALFRGEAAAPQSRGWQLVVVAAVAVAVAVAAAHIGCVRVCACLCVCECCGLALWLRRLRFALQSLRAFAALDRCQPTLLIIPYASRGCGRRGGSLWLCDSLFAAVGVSYAMGTKRRLRYWPTQTAQVTHTRHSAPLLALVLFFSTPQRYRRNNCPKIAVVQRPRQQRSSCRRGEARAGPTQTQRSRPGQSPAAGGRAFDIITYKRSTPSESFGGRTT